MKFNNLGLAQGMASNFDTSVAKKLKLKVKKFWGLIPTFAEVTWEKLVGGLFGLPSWIVLNLGRNLKQYLRRNLSFSNATGWMFTTLNKMSLFTNVFQEFS